MVSMGNEKLKRGFTLVELLAVIVILAIILAIAVPGIFGMIKSSTISAMQIDAKTILDTARLKKSADDSFDPETVNKNTIMETLGLSNDNYESLGIVTHDGVLYLEILGKGKWKGFSACGSFQNMVVYEGSCELDFVPPTIEFDNNGNTNWAKSRSITVTVIDAGGVDINSLKYQWTTNTTEPSESSFVSTFTNGGTISSPQGVTGSYYLWVIAKDKSNYTTIAGTNAFYLDNINPVITVTGNNYININMGTSYTDAGATATDADSGITGSVVATGTVNINVPGSYTITYSISDNAGNIATAIRTINVIDVTAPTLTFSMNGNSTYAKSRSTSVTVTDDDGVNASSLKYQWTTGTTAPTEASFSTIFTNGATLSTPVGVTGSYYLWIIAKDNTGNTTIQRTNAFNLDNTIPVISVTGSNPVNVTQGSAYTDAGATATDAHSSVGSVSTSGSVNVNTLGTYILTYNVSDAAGNAATSVTRTVYVIPAPSNLAYTGASQTYTAPVTGTYKLEVWGAQGGGTSGGKGGYARGNIALTSGQSIYIYIGQAGGTSTSPFNGGGVSSAATSGGGGTDVRVGGTALANRKIVAGGGGGASTAYAYIAMYSAGGAGGGTSGIAGEDTTGQTYATGGGGGTQTAGGAGGGGGGTGNSGAKFSVGEAGALGVGGTGVSYTGYEANGYGGGGGGGYYGGGGGSFNRYILNTIEYSLTSGGGGGSSYIGGVTAGQTIAGNASMPNPTGGTMIGRAGNGYAIISFVGY